MTAAVISDTHHKHQYLNIPDTDMIICCGDFSHSKDGFHDFLNWYANLPQKHKILVAGNHDGTAEEYGYEKTFKICKDLGVIYLQDTFVEIEGTKIYGSPWTVTYLDWHFMDSDVNLAKKWEKIPDDINILITHGPEYGVLDFANTQHIGSVTLGDRLDQLKDLKFHLFGHVHVGFGMKGQYDDGYISINAAMKDGDGEYKREVPIIYF